MGRVGGRGGESGGEGVWGKIGEFGASLMEAIRDIHSNCHDQVKKFPKLTHTHTHTHTHSQTHTQTHTHKETVLIKKKVYQNKFATNVYRQSDLWRERKRELERQRETERKRQRGERVRRTRGDRERERERENCWRQGDASFVYTPYCLCCPQLDGEQLTKRLEREFCSMYTFMSCLAAF